jgi:unsaturated rhamnogalacturonyl hydrolase
MKSCRLVSLVVLGLVAAGSACSSSDSTAPANTVGAGGASGSGGVPSGGGGSTQAGAGGVSPGGGGAGGASGGVQGGSAGASGAVQGGSGGASGSVQGGAAGVSGSGGAIGGAAGDASVADSSIKDSGPVFADVAIDGAGLSGPAFQLDAITDLMRRAAAWGFANLDKDRDGGGASNLLNDWSRGTFMTGVMGTYRVTNDPQYLNLVKIWGDAHAWKPNEPVWNADNMCCMQAYCERYLMEPTAANAYMYQPSLANIDGYIGDAKRTGHGSWGWEDAMYMSPPVIAIIGRIKGQAIYFDKLTDYWWDNVKFLYDPTYHLYYWADEASYLTTPKGNPEFWGPGNAWVIGGMIRVMMYMPETYPQRQKWIDLFREFSDAIRSKQQPDGFWRTSLYEPTEFPSPENSCTSFFTYAFAMGMLYGFLDPAVYLPVVQKSWPAVASAVDANGRAVRCQPWSNNPGGAGTTNNTPECQGAVQLAGEGMYNLIRGTKPQLW